MAPKYLVLSELGAYAFQKSYANVIKGAELTTFLGLTPLCDPKQTTLIKVLGDFHTEIGE
jgi:hypothetical protein